MKPVRIYKLKAGDPLIPKIEALDYYKYSLDTWSPSQGHYTKRSSVKEVNKFLKDYLCVNGLPSTCSMCEVGRLDDAFIYDIAFTVKLIRALVPSNFCVAMFNTNEQITGKLPRGVKKVYSYEGSIGSVFTYMVSLDHE